MSRIYDNQPLQSIPVENHSYPKLWEPLTRRSGNGIVLEGIIHNRSRHVITDLSNKKHRHVVFHVRPKFILKRKFNSVGDEVEPNFDLTHKVNTGFLHSSYKTEAKGTSDKISQSEAERLIQISQLEAWTSKYCNMGSLSFWIHESELDPLEVGNGDKVRIKTDGDGPFICAMTIVRFYLSPQHIPCENSISKIEADTQTISNAAGPEVQVGESWTDKIMGMKEQGDLGPSGDKAEGGGADDDEWDD